MNETDYNEINAVRELLAKRNRGDIPSIAEARKADEEESSTLPLPEGVTVEPVNDGGVIGEWVRAANVRPDAVMLYLHGGAYVFCSPATHRQMVAALSAAAGSPAFSLDYRLAPEATFPAAVEDAVQGYRWLLDRGFAPERIVIAGDSAGGGLAVATMLSLLDAGIVLPAAAICISPWADLTMTAKSYTMDGAALATRGRVITYAEMYLKNVDTKHPLASPIFANLTGLPPMLIQVGSADPFYDDSINLAARAKACGVETELEVWEEMVHVWHYFHSMLGEGRRAITRIGEFVKAKIGEPSARL
ncbi:MAG: alpha/beta hydrolase [Acidobacteriota bacterium]